MLTGGEEVRLGSMWLMDAMWLTVGVNVPMEYRRSAETVTENLLTYTVIYRIVYTRALSFDIRHSCTPARLYPLQQRPRLIAAAAAAAFTFTRGIRKFENSPQCLGVARFLCKNNPFIQYNIKFVKRHVAVASEALANRTVKKHRRRRTNVL